MSETPALGGLQIAGVTKTFRQASRELHVLRGIDFAVAPGEMTALVGPSGSGKSTLLHIAGLLERPDSGEITIAGQGVGRLGDDARSRLRSRALGFVYQFHHLLPEFSALENVVVPQMIGGRARSEAKRRARSLLETVGLAERLDHRPARLSGGEQQRVAIARALANQPAVLLADEPTGNLDPETAGRVFAVLRELVRQTRVAALIATHNLELARSMDRVLRLEQGRVV